MEPRGVSLREGDNVLLLANATVVAVGSVHATEPSASCHGMLLGPGRLSIRVLTAIDGSQLLPYPSPGADSISEAVNSYVLWDTRFVQLIGRETPRQSNLEGRAGSSANTMLQGPISTKPPMLLLGPGTSSFSDSQSSSGPKASRVRPEQELYFKQRKNWSNVEVVLLSKVECKPLAEGVIFLPFANSAVDNEEIGEENAGVLVTSLLQDADAELVERDLPDFFQEDPRTVRWPILRLKIVANGSILGDLYKAYVDSDIQKEMQGGTGEPAEKKKRSYNSVKRSKPDPALVEKKKLTQRSLQRLTPESIAKALAFVCPCKNECMRKVNKKDIIDERAYFYGEPFAKRIEYILTKWEHPELDKGKMLFIHGQTVCKPAFWNIYGFVRASFYNYEKAYKMGQRVGFHGNHGTLKPKDTTLFAKVCMKTFFQQSAEPLPHKESKNEATDGIMYRIPKAYTRDDVYEEIRTKMQAVNLQPISRISFNDIWKKDFPNYGIHTSSAFAKCDKCHRYMVMLHREKRSAERAKWEHRREMHLKHQMSGRNVYYTHRELSTRTPSMYLSFIHDAMDLAKTIIPRLSDKVKSLMGQVSPLPLKVVGILNHGHEPDVVAHVTIGGLWKGDPNYTIASVAKQLRDYENFYGGDKTGDLAFQSRPLHPLFEALLSEEVFTKTVLGRKGQTREEYFKMGAEETSESSRAATPRSLPPHLYIQLDNSGKDNKNWMMMAFCSELVARGCCKTITMSFLVVGHTHEDVDAFFSKINAAQGGKNIESLPHFLAEVYHAQSSKAYPRLIQEVANYKSHVEDYVVKISGQSAPVAFRFYMRDNIPVYQVQETYGGKWVPTYGRSIWKRRFPDSETDFGVVLPPRRNPLAKPIISQHAKQTEILGFIKNYLKYKEEFQSSTDPTSNHFAEDRCLIQYWKKVADVLQTGWEINENAALQDGFWPTTDFGSGYNYNAGSNEERGITVPHPIQRETEEELEARDEIFVGDRSARKMANFVPTIDIKDKMMVLIRPSADFPCQDCLWVAKATGSVCQDDADPNVNKLPIQWWRPKHGSRQVSLADRYSQCIQRDVTWEIDPGYSGSDWIEADSCVYAWTSRARKDKVHLPPTVQEIALRVLERIRTEEEQ